MEEWKVVTIKALLKKSRVNHVGQTKNILVCIDVFILHMNLIWIVFFLSANYCITNLCWMFLMRRYSKVLGVSLIRIHNSMMSRPLYLFIGSLFQLRFYYFVLEFIQSRLKVEKFDPHCWGLNDNLTFYDYGWVLVYILPVKSDSMGSGLSSFHQP